MLGRDHFGRGQSTPANELPQLPGAASTTLVLELRLLVVQFGVMSEMPSSEPRDNISDLVGRAQCGGEATILTHYAAPTAVVISNAQYQRLKHAPEESGSYDLPPEIMAQIEESRRQPGRDNPRPRRASRE